MKRKILAVVLIFAMCFTFAGCGGKDGGEGDKTKEPEEPKVTSIIGDWECEKVEITDNGEKMDEDTVKAMFGDDVKSVFGLSAYSDGSAYISLMGEEGAVLWKEAKDKEYEFVIPESGEESGNIRAKLDGEKLVVSMEEIYQSDGKDQTTEMVFTMKYAGKKSRIIEGWDITLEGDDVYDMSNAMIGGMCVEVNGMLYGDYGGKEWGGGAFTAAKIKDGKLEEPVVVAEGVNALHLSEYDGDIYGIFDYEKIIKVEGGKTEVETIYEGVCDYMQVTEDGIFFTDENNQYCRIDHKGQNKETIMKKEVYYPYQINSEYMVYQDDADGETLHMYNMKTGKDSKLTDIVSYEPMICGEYLYFRTPGSEDDMSYMGRLNLYSGKQEKSKTETLLFEYYVTPENFSVAKGGFVTAEFDEWDKFADKDSAGFKFYPIYSNGEIWITRSSGENFMGPRTFGTDDEKSIGYSYVRK